MKMVKVFITKEDRKLGLRHNMHHCPAARVVQRITGKYCCVDPASGLPHGSPLMQPGEIRLIGFGERKINLSFWKSFLIALYDSTGIMLLRSISIPESWLVQEPEVGTVLETGELWLPKENGKYISITA